MQLFSFYHIKILTLSHKDNIKNYLRIFRWAFDRLPTSLTVGIPLNFITLIKILCSKNKFTKLNIILKNKQINILEPEN